MKVSSLLIGVMNGWLMIQLFGPIPDIAITGLILLTGLVMGLEIIQRRSSV